MKTDNSASKITKNQQIVLGLCGAILLSVLLYMFFFNTSTPVTNVSANDPKYKDRIKNEDLKNQATPTNNPVDQVKQVVNNELGEGMVAELSFDDLVLRGKGEADVDRNLFDYPPPPPPPQAPPPPPPTIPISRLTPTQVYAQTKPFELTVIGQGFTEQDRIYINGGANYAPTKFISDREVRVTVPQSLFSSPTQLRVEVKRPGAEKDFFSNTLNVSIMQAPPPRFTMLGQYNDGGGKNAHAVLTEGEKRSVAKIGDTVGNAFKIVSVGPNFVEVEDIAVALGVRHQVKMKDENAGSAAAATNYQFNQAYTAQQPQQQTIFSQNAEEAEQPAAVQAVNNNIANQNNQGSQLTPEQQAQQEKLREQRDEMIRRRQELIQQRLNNSGVNGPIQRR